MKNKKVLVILLVLVFIVMLVPIIVWARTNLGIPVQKELSKEEFKSKQEQEKIDWVNNQQKNTNTYSAKQSETIDQSIKEQEVASDEEGKKIEEILCRFYKDKYTSLIAKIEENQDKMPLIELYSQPYAEELFELIIDVIKNKDISYEEKEILKELLDLQYVFIKNSTMKIKFDEVLNND